LPDKTEQLVSLLMNNNRDLILVLDKNGKITDTNHSDPHPILDIKVNMLYKRFTDLDCHTERDKVTGMLERLKDGKRLQESLLLRDKDGVEVPFLVEAVPFPRSRFFRGALLILQDLTGYKGLQHMVNYMTYYDQLTGLPNRIFFYDKLAAAMASSLRDQTPLSVLMICLDNLREINETHGLSVGDLLLQSFVSRIKNCLQKEDVFARLFGDEFTVLMEGIDRHQTAEYVDRILDVCQEPFFIGGHEIYAFPSLGIGVCPHDGKDIDTLLKNSAVALGLARRQGNDRYRFYRSDYHKQFVKQIEMANRLAKALKNEELFLHYQPQLDLGTGQIVGMEALIRWHNPEMGEVSPSEFIPLAEETGLIIAIGEWVLHTACRQNKQWQLDGFRPVRISVNLSGRQLFQENLIASVNRVLTETGLDPCYLEFEITESMALDAERAGEMLNRLKKLGVQVSIDDFGTGYSSLRYLRDFPIDKLKIDKSFLGNIMTDVKDKSIVTTIISIAHNLNLKVIAEGVESLEQQNFLKSQHCDEIQGYLVSKPLPAEQIKAMFEAMTPNGEEH
jgi:diguanylate cyclase (GGDEF)-like protein